MTLPHAFDNRTLLACQALVTGMFGITLLGIHLSYPKLLGVRSIAIGFLLGCPSIVLIAMRGVAPAFLSIIVANVGIYIGYLLLYRGLQQHFATRAGLRLAYGVVALASCIHVYYTLVHDNIVARIVLAAITLCVMKIFMAVTLLRNARGNVHRILFALSMSLFAAGSYVRAPLTLIHGSPANFLQQNSVQTYTLLMGVIFVCVEGIFFLTLISFEFTNSISRQAQLDPLTGTLNRRSIEEKLRDELARSARAGSVLSVLLIDIDHFKAINDTHGHAKGDAALKDVADAITGGLRPFDHLGRFGGDEFLLLLPELASNHAAAVAEHIRVNLTSPLAPTLSIGIAQSDPGELLPSLLARADAALYQAKRDGRNCIRIEPPPDAAPRAPHPAGRI